MQILISRIKSNKWSKSIKRPRKILRKLNDFFTFRSRNLSSRISQGLMILSDSLLVWGIGILIFLYYVTWSEDYILPYLSIVTLYTCLMVVMYFLSNLYSVEPAPPPAKIIKKIVSINTSLFLLLIVLLFSLKVSSNFSRGWLLSWYVMATFTLCFVRILFYYSLRKYAFEGRLTRNAVIFGSGGQAIKLMHEIDNQDYPWSRIVGCFDDRTDRTPSLIGKQPIQGDINSLIQFIRDNHCEEVLIALPWSADQRIQEIIRKIKILPVTIRLVPDIIGLNYSQYRYDNFSGVPVLTIQDKPLLAWDYVGKEIEDKFFAIIFLTLLTPVFFILAILIKLDSPGPVFFRQKRYGLNNRLIEIYKFRSLHVSQQDDNAEKLVTKNDSRVTRIGAFIRRTSLDELPQLINVLKGEMSIVGPRPHALKASAAGELYDEAVNEYAARHKVKPGITGWAQVNGWRGETDTKEKIVKRVEFDVYYIENWSLFLDFKIVLKTPIALVFQKNAY